MVLFTFHRLAAVLSVFAFSGRVSSAPADLEQEAFSGLDSKALGILDRAKQVTPTAPHWVIYSDKYISGTTGPPPVAQVKVGRM